jgi:hypothetical protein
MISKNAKAFLMFLFGWLSGHCTPVNAQVPSTDSNHISICSLYENHRNWLPECYLTNAHCACDYLPKDSAAEVIRRHLLFALDTTGMEFKMQAKKMKSDYLTGVIGKKEYEHFVKKNIVPKIYNDHVNAFRKAGCPDGPGAYWEWKIACTREFKNCKRMVRYNLKFGGGCNKEGGSW